MNNNLKNINNDEADYVAISFVVPLDKNWDESLDYIDNNIPSELSVKEISLDSDNKEVIYCFKKPLSSESKLRLFFENLNEIFQNNEDFLPHFVQYYCVENQSNLKLVEGGD